MAAIGRFELFKSLKNTPGVRPLSDHKAAFQQAQIPATRINGIGQELPIAILHQPERINSLPMKVAVTGTNGRRGR